MQMNFVDEVFEAFFAVCNQEFIFGFSFGQVLSFMMTLLLLMSFVYYFFTGFLSGSSKCSGSSEGAEDVSSVIYLNGKKVDPKD